MHLINRIILQLRKLLQSITVIQRLKGYLQEMTLLMFPESRKMFSVISQHLNHGLQYKTVNEWVGGVW